MDLSIKYCGMWNYKPQAASLAAALKKVFDSEAQLIEGSKGIFDVKLEGELIFSKDKTGRFPENDEVIQLIKDRQS